MHPCMGCPSWQAIGSLAGGYSGGYSDILGDVDTWAQWALQAGDMQIYAAVCDVLRRCAHTCLRMCA